MKKHAAAFALVALVAGTPALSQHKAHSHWSYSGESGPENWSKVDAKNALCAIGRNQSPIDIADLIDASLKPLGFAYKGAPAEVVNNGHTIQVDIPAGNALSVEGRRFELKQFHFHAPSENTIRGKHYPLEVHLVHADKDGNLAVVGVMFEEGAAHPALDKVWASMPAKAGEKAAVPAALDPTNLLPPARQYYRFNGSLTTPPCSEGVIWLVMRKTLTASKAQVEKFAKTVGFANNRPIQPVNARPVLR